MSRWRWLYLSGDEDFSEFTDMSGACKPLAGPGTTGDGEAMAEHSFVFFGISLSLYLCCVWAEERRGLLTPPPPPPLPLVLSVRGEERMEDKALQKDEKDQEICNLALSVSISV